MRTSFLLSAIFAVLVGSVGIADEVLQNGRFTVNSNNEISDVESDLEWMMGPDEDMSWIDAGKWIRGICTYKGEWRRPTLNEARQLFAYETATRSYIAEPPFEHSGRFIWTDLKNQQSARVVHFFDLPYGVYGPRSVPLHQRVGGRVLAVRGECQEKRSTIPGVYAR